MNRLLTQTTSLLSFQEHTHLEKKIICSGKKTIKMLVCNLSIDFMKACNISFIINY